MGLRKSAAFDSSDFVNMKLKFGFCSVHIRTVGERSPVSCFVVLLFDEKEGNKIETFCIEGFVRAAEEWVAVCWFILSMKYELYFPLDILAYFLAKLSV